MKYQTFKIKNFKGINELDLSLDNEPRSKIITLVGLNESGKTTILEALDFFRNGLQHSEHHVLIPKDKKLRFSENISVNAKLTLDEDDIADITSLLDQNNLVVVGDFGPINIERLLSFSESKFVEEKFNIDVAFKVRKSRGTTEKNLSEFSDTYENVKQSIQNRRPNIIYYENFLFDFPTRIYLEQEKKKGNNTKQQFFRQVIQDVLDSIDPALNIQKHIVERINSGKNEDKEALDSTISRMSSKITNEVFTAWGQLFNSDNKQILITYSSETTEDGQSESYLELKLKHGSDQYQISERSLGFKWFFTFLLFTEFRKNRDKDQGETLFLLDEPASNLHSTAQRNLLSTFESLVSDRCTLIYATHSHHLINPSWLSGAYIVVNEALDYENEFEYDAATTDIKAFLYKQFVSSHPNQKSYFQPILDALDYQPGLLEDVPNIVILEGKSDFYIFNYIRDLYHEDKKIRFYPGGGAGHNDEIIRLYLAWVREFAILLDDDRAGKKEKERYIKEFGALVEGNTFTYEDIDSNFSGFTVEDLFSDQDKLKVTQTFDPTSTKFEKSKFNTGIQTLYSEKSKFEFDDTTKSNFEKIFEFLAPQFS